MGGDHLNLEEEHTWRYRTPVSMINLMIRLSVFGFFYMILYNQLFLNDQGKIWNIQDLDYLINPSSMNDYPMRYESMYIVGKDMKY